MGRIHSPPVHKYSEWIAFRDQEIPTIYQISTINTFHIHAQVNLGCWQTCHDCMDFSCLFNHFSEHKI